MTDLFDVRYTKGAREDLLRLFQFLLERAEDAEDFDAAFEAIEAIKIIIDAQLRRAPFSCRKVGRDPLFRELVIPFKKTGYVALFDINPDQTIDVVAIRHQREADYH